MNSKQKIFELADISQVYLTRQYRFTALKHINLTVEEGDFVALLGPSGCGKSTLLRIITGLQQPTLGQVIYKDVPLKGINENATIVFQTFALFPWLSVLQNVELALEARGLPKNMRTPKALDLLDRVGLDGFESAYPRELSGGMRQKVGFARAMAVEPELLCLDEPFSALDVLSAESLRGDLLELWLEGKIPCKAILLVTHNIEEAVSLADRIVVMEKDPGRIVKEIKLDLKHPRDPQSQPFQRYMDEIYEALAGKTKARAIEAGGAPGEAGTTRLLPHVVVNEIATFLEYSYTHTSNTRDIFRIANELGIDADETLQLTEAAEILGFATVDKGDITITASGQEFMDADILKRKEIFAKAVMELPIFKWMVSLIQKSAKKRLHREIILGALELEFPEKQAKRLLDTLINWGRYAEVISYDDNTELIYSEAPQFAKKE
jgi:NitT/TauT family transport system ATP-binding protein